MRAAALSSADQYKAIELYKNGLSAQQIANTFGVSIGAVYYPLRRFQIPRRTSSETNRIRFRASPLSFKVKEKLSLEDQQLKLAGTMVYWAEGYKLGQVVDFANSDPAMAYMFLKFLREICGVNEKRVRCHLYCYQGQDVSGLTEFWSKLLNVPQKQFIKPYINPAQKPGARGPRMVHGLIHVCYSDVRLLEQIQSWILEYANCVGGRVVNYTRL